METEKDKMLSGRLYNPLDKVLSADRRRSRLLMKALNNSDDEDTDKRQQILKKLLPNAAANLWLQPPFYCDYGYNMYLAENVFFNFNCVVLDVAAVYIGSRTLIGPNVQIYTATHPLNYHLRRTGLEFAKPVTIGEDVWIGGSTVICPGVSIGNHTVIGAGSVVTKDIPEDVIAAGNPCKVLRGLTPEELKP